MFSGVEGSLGTYSLSLKNNRILKAGSGTTPLYFGSDSASPKTPPRQKRHWKTFAFIGAWLSTLGLGGHLSYQQHETNQDLFSKNQALTTQLAETNQKLHDFATTQELNTLQSFLDQLQTDASKRMEDVSNKASDLHQNLSNIREEINSINHLMLTPELVNRVKPTTANVLVKVKGRPVSRGSGVWMPGRSADEILLLTNEHVVNKTKSLAKEGIPLTAVSYVIIQNGAQAEIPATLIHHYAAYDMALLKVEKLPEGAQFATIRDINREPLKQGENVFTVGAPVGLNDTVTAGIISHTGRGQPILPKVPFIQTDAPINPGNSGGGLFDGQGRLIGLNNMIFRRVPNITDGLGFSIRADAIQDYLKRWPELLAQEEEERAKRLAAIPIPKHKPAPSVPKPERKPKLEKSPQ